MNATRAATVKARSLGGVISLGRVQTPTLAIMVRREKEIQAFEPVPYWIVEASFEPVEANGRPGYKGRWFDKDGERLSDGPRGRGHRDGCERPARHASPSCAPAPSARSRRCSTT